VVILGASSPLRRWTTNNKDLQNELNRSETGSAASVQSIGTKEEQSKVFGLIWSVEEDSIRFDTNSLTNLQEDLQKGCTKRSTLSISSKLFDPLGLISPIVIVPKILLQETWQTGLSWDEPLPQELTKIWHTWIESLTALSKLRIDRHYY
jgi:Pao retrotransposon peptidase